MYADHVQGTLEGACTESVKVCLHPRLLCSVPAYEANIERQ